MKKEFIDKLRDYLIEKDNYVSWFEIKEHFNISTIDEFEIINQIKNTHGFCVKNVSGRSLSFMFDIDSYLVKDEVKPITVVNSQNIVGNNINAPFQSDFKESFNNKIEQTIKPKEKDKQLNPIIAKILKLWWIIIAGIIIGIILLCIEYDYFVHP